MRLILAAVAVVWPVALGDCQARGEAMRAWSVEKVEARWTYLAELDLRQVWGRRCRLVVEALESSRGRKDLLYALANASVPLDSFVRSTMPERFKWRPLSCVVVSRDRAAHERLLSARRTYNRATLKTPAWLSSPGLIATPDGAYEARTHLAFTHHCGSQQATRARVCRLLVRQRLNYNVFNEQTRRVRQWQATWRRQTYGFSFHPDRYVDFGRADPGAPWLEEALVQYLGTPHIDTADVVTFGRVHTAHVRELARDRAKPSLAGLFGAKVNPRTARYSAMAWSFAHFCLASDAPEIAMAFRVAANRPAFANALRSLATSPEEFDGDRPWRALEKRWVAHIDHLAGR